MFNLLGLNSQSGQSPLPNLDPQWVNVVVLLVVAAATIYYAYYTRKLMLESRRTADEMYQARLAEIEPHVKATLGWIGPVAVCLKLQNFGRGPARNLVIKYSYAPSDGPPKQWSQQMLAPGEYARLLLDPTYLEQLVAKYDEILVTGSCQNIMGRKYDISEVLKLKEIQATVKKAPQLLETSSDELLKEIQRELEELNRNFENTIDVLKQSGIVTKTKSEKAAEDAELLSRLKEMREKAASKRPE